MGLVYIRGRRINWKEMEGKSREGSQEYSLGRRHCFDGT